MTRITARIRGWRLRRRRQKAARKNKFPLREFVYLDDVSVYSLLASRVGPIATDLTETEAVSLSGAASATLAGNFGVARTDVKSQVEAAQSVGTQVLRKSIVQSTFRDLFDIERRTLLLAPPVSNAPPPVEGGAADLGAMREDERYNEWIIDPETFVRGGLIEVEVELEAEPVFRVAAFINAFLDIVEDNTELFGVDNVIDAAQVRSMSRLFESLLSGLVPIRGRLVDYSAVTVNGQMIIVHNRVLDDVRISKAPVASPIYVVGVTERGLFWKDIRRVLFGGARFRMLCRVSTPNLQSTWKPIKLVDVLSEASPILGQHLSEFGDDALALMDDAITRSATSRLRSEGSGLAVLTRYVHLLGEHHGVQLDPQKVTELIGRGPEDMNWLRSVDKRRTILRDLTGRADQMLGTVTDSQTASQLRMTSMVDEGFGIDGTGLPSTEPISSRDQPKSDESLIVAEIVAIYW